MVSVQGGSGRLAGVVAETGQGGRVVTHVTRAELEAAIRRGGQVAGEIVPPNTLYGAPGKGLYAFEGPGPISKLRKYFGGGLDARYTVEFQIPESAAGAFHAPPITGPLNIMRRLAGVRVAPGSVDLATGKFTAYAGGRYAWLTQTTERWVIAADLGADAAVGAGIYIATSDD